MEQITKEQLNMMYLLDQIKQQEARNKHFSSEFLQNFEVTKELGGGSFGIAHEVRKLFHSGNPFDALDLDMGDSYGFRKKFAIKIIPNFKTIAGLSEVQALSGLIHPNIVRCYKAWIELKEKSVEAEWTSINSLLPEKCVGLKSYSTDDSAKETKRGDLTRCLFLQYELCSDGNLQTFLENRDKSSLPIDRVETMHIVWQIIEGLIYLQFNEIVHGDLKPDNIFLRRTNGFLGVKIGDFGLSDSNVSVQNLENVNDNYDPLKIRRPYTAPEHIKSVFVCQGDMYSFGLIFMEMLLVFSKQNDRRMATINAMYPSYDENDSDSNLPQILSQQFSKEFNCIKKLLSYKITDRPSAYKLKFELGSVVQLDTLTCNVITLENANKSKLLNCFIPFAESICSRKIKSFDSVKILTELFYKIFSIPDRNIQNVIKISRFISTVTDRINRGGDGCYRNLLLATYLEHTLGDDIETVKRQIRALRALNEFKNRFVAFKGHKTRIRRMLGIEELCDDLVFKIKNSQKFCELSETDKERIGFEITMCQSIGFSNDSSEKELTSALEILRKINKMYDEGILKDEGTEDEALFNRSLRNERMALVLQRLEKTEEADTVYYTLIEWMCTSGPGLIYFTTLQLILPYVIFLRKEEQFAKARTYCECLSYIFSVKTAIEPEFSVLYSIVLKELVRIYYELGYEKEVDYILSGPAFKAECNVNYNLMSNSSINETFGVLNSLQIAEAGREAYGLPRRNVNSSSGECFLQNNNCYGPLFENCHFSIHGIAKIFRDDLHQKIKIQRDSK